MNKLLLKTSKIKVIEIFSGQKTLEELFIKMILSQQLVPVADNKKF